MNDSTTSVRDVVDAVTTGDLNAANTAFDAVLKQKREDAWVNTKHEFARTAFDASPPEATAGIDTGITGDPAEVPSEEE
jgi:phage head maturation protease